MFSRSSRRRPKNVLRTYRITLLGTSFKRQIRTSTGRHFKTSPVRQIGTFPGLSNRIFRGRPGDVRGGRPSVVLGTNICRLDLMLPFDAEAVARRCSVKKVFENSQENTFARVSFLIQLQASGL